MSLDAPLSDAELIRIKAEREGRRAGYLRVEGTPPNPPTTLTTTAKPGDPPVWIRMPDAPITLRIPWSCLVSDNAMYVTRNGKRYKSPRYREARAKVAAIAREAMQGRRPLDQPLALTARVWVPDRHRRDVHNFGATLADALTRLVFTDDKWLYRVTWERSGVDVDAPRAEIVIALLPPTEP